jgi:hypothetical protein
MDAVLGLDPVLTPTDPPSESQDITETGSSRADSTSALFMNSEVKLDGEVI